ncbi:MAG: cytochrome c4 [Gammaproteobacteria bacterium]|nr:cytochrome c4 [Gammaproteobacteria bacterium]
MKKFLAITITLIVSSISMPAMAGGDPVAGKEKAAQCASCHGADGNSLNPAWPKLAGQHADYLVKQLWYFEHGERENAMMKPMASVLDEQGREDVAAYYASQKASIGEAAPELVELGEKIYRSGNSDSGVAPCMGCHGPNGAGNPAALYPALRGQHAQYVENQMHGFAEGKRVNENAKKMMQILAARMTNREIRAVASYIQGLH